MDSFTDFLVKLGNNIRAARLKAGLRQIDVNTRIGLTYRHYQNIEAGRINLTVSTLARLAKLFEVRIQDFLEGC